MNSMRSAKREREKGNAILSTQRCAQLSKAEMPTTYQIKIKWS